MKWFKKKDAVSGLVRKHFGSLKPQSLVTAARVFPVTARVDLQSSLERLFAERFQARLLGVHSAYSHEMLTFSHLINDTHFPVTVGPLQHEEIDVGELEPKRCLVAGVWLAREQGTPFAVFLSPAEKFGRNTGVHIEIAVPPGEAGLELSRRFLTDLERLVAQSGSYRGKVLSLEVMDNYSGRAGAVKVHRLHPVPREEVILPDKTLRLLERNVTDFVKQREGLRGLRMGSKKGLLFYGPPGTGKTHTVHYLASQLKDHTTLLITSEQVGLLDEYFQLARFLQPAMLVVEDVDLIARAREQMRSACEESLLNKLLNEMDGLREEATVLFILTTNRPDQLEAALASRPGRVDQAIEFPLPDEAGRRKLVRLYARELTLSDELLEAIVKKTNRASAAFIKELMRRAAQYLLEAKPGGALGLEQIEAALDEMLFSGGALNVKLLGGAADS